MLSTGASARALVTDEMRLFAIKYSTYSANRKPEQGWLYMQVAIKRQQQARRCKSFRCQLASFAEEKETDKTPLLQGSMQAIAHIVVIVVPTYLLLYLMPCCCLHRRLQQTSMERLVDQAASCSSLALCTYIHVAP